MSLIDDRRRYWSWGKGSAAVVAVALVWAGVAGAQDQASPAGQTHRPRVVKTGVKTPGVQRPLSDLHPETVFPVEGSPDWSVMTKDAVWITSARANHVVQLLPATGKPGLIVDIARPCSGLAYGWGSVWVPSCGAHKLLRLDEATGKVMAEIPADPANSEGGIAVGAGSVWLVVKPSTLIRVDAKKNVVVATLELPSESEDPVFGEGYLWVTSFGHDQLLKVDPKTNEVVDTIAVGPKPRFLTVGAGAVWTLNQGDGSISRVEAKSDRLVATIECGIPGTGGDITFGAGSVWATLYDFPLTQVDAKTNIPVKQWAGKGGDGLRFGFGSLWLSNGGQQNVWRVSPEQP
jgi:virginiamycin B lyase